jgi:CheY-like chemotaxis protein
MLSNDGQDIADGQLTFGNVNYDKRARLLLIDDVAVHRIIICKMAAKAGLATFEAESCGDVVRLTTTKGFECVTLDLSLGERAGTEVLRHFALCGFRAPIVIVSGSDTGATQYAYDLGVTLGLNMLDPVGKPVDLSKLREIFVAIAAEWTEARRLEAAAL